MKALGTIALALLILLASCFTYAHRALYQHRFEQQLAFEATRTLRLHPEFSRVNVSFVGLDAQLTGVVALPRHRDEALRLVDALPGARAVERRNDIVVTPALRLEQNPAGGYEGVGWIASGEWRAKAGALFSAVAPQTRVDLVSVQPHPAVQEPTFLGRPAMPEFLRAYFASVTNGHLTLDNTHIQMGGRVRTETDRLRLVALAERALGGGGEVRVENDIEVLPPAAAPRGRTGLGGAAAGGTAAGTAGVGSFPADLPGALRAGTVFFGAGSVQVKPDEMSKLDAVAATIRRLAPQGRFVVTGHADSSGDPAANQRLSLKRAEAVANALAARGLPRSRIEVKAVIDNAPAGKGDGPEARRQARRVEITPR
ncbi:MAG TPA: hypothetical protein DCM86_06785 [Verrucomicrobiales bacterium]|nr:hypothetical protein [Verrucomicrobiales bacterium]